MLVISRRQGERIFVGDDIEIVVTGLYRKSVRIGIQAPKSLAVVRGEVRDSIIAANRAAAKSSLDPDALVEQLRQPVGGKNRQGEDE